MNQRREKIDGARDFVASLTDIMVIIKVVIIFFYYFKCKRNPCQHGLVKSKYTVTNFVSYLDFISPLVHKAQLMQFILI
jgi:hypothetical protein